MKNLGVFSFVFILLIILFSCEKDRDTIGSPDFEAGTSFTEEGDLIANQELMLKALSKWVATTDAKQWLLNKRGPAKNVSALNEVLVLEIICSPEGRNFVDTYNTIAGTSYNVDRFSDYVSAENQMLALTLDAYFDDFIDNITDYTPLVSDKNRDNNFMDGQRYDAQTVLRETGAALVIGFRLTQAENTVLYDPSSNKFNLPLAYPFCSERLFMDRLNEFSDPICTGEIPLSITADVQRVFYEVCGGHFTFQPGGGDEVCDNGIDDDGDGLTDCEDPDCCGTENCGPCGEICDNGIDDDGDGLVDADDPDCENNSPCMRDHYMEDNFFYELEMNSPQALTGMGGNLCDGVQLLDPDPFSLGASHMSGQQLFPAAFDELEGLEVWYDFLIKVHLGTPSGSDGIFQDVIYRFHIWELANEPEFHITYHSGGGGGAALLHVDRQGLTEAYPVGLEMVPMFVFSDVCGSSNWDPSIHGDKIALSMHETDNCSLRTSDGTVGTNTTQNTYTSGFSINLGLRSANFARTGGIMYTDTDVLATTETNSISSTYTTTYADDYYIGRINYGYCWTDQGVNDQVHQINFGNLLHLRILSQICE